MQNNGRWKKRQICRCVGVYTPREKLICNVALEDAKKTSRQFTTHSASKTNTIMINRSRYQLYRYIPIQVPGRSLSLPTAEEDSEQGQVVRPRVAIYRR